MWDSDSIEYSSSEKGCSVCQEHRDAIAQCVDVFVLDSVMSLHAQQPPISTQVTRVVS